MKHAWWVWETEYPEEGFFAFDAESADEAKALYRRATGTERDADLDISASPVMAADVEMLRGD